MADQSEPTAKKEIIVVYHDRCVDGLASAWALHQKWRYDPTVAVTYIPFAHHNPERSGKALLAALKPGAEVYFVDVAPGKKLLNALLLPDDAGEKKAASIRILDHHKTAAENLKNYKPPSVDGFTPPALDILIDDRSPSASHMIWQMMHPDQDCPPFLSMLDKMDRNEDLETDDDFAAAAYIDSKSLRSLAEAFNACTELADLTHEQMAGLGKPILADQKNRIEKVGNNVMYIDMRVLPETEPVTVPVVNADVQDFGRSITNYLRGLGREAGSGVALAWFVNSNGSVSVSIRTEGNPDASQVATYFHDKVGVTGGGHKTSAAIHFASFAEFSKAINLQPAGNAPPNGPQSGTKFRLN